MGESSCLFVSRSDFEAIGGYDERFSAPGGGLVSHDIYRRLCSLGTKDLVVLLGEGSFHQLHGGVATNAKEEDFDQLYAAWHEEYRALRGTPHLRPTRTAHVLGHAPPEMKRFLLLSAERLPPEGGMAAAP
jgi:hypothetical protein